MSKNKIANIDLFAEFEDLFRCPICSGKMKLVHLKSLVCINRHCFDLSRQGYVNMLSHARQTKYDRQMFEARRRICHQGFFKPLHTKISKIINNKIECQSQTIKVLDAGCGEGSFLSNVMDTTGSSKTGYLGVGLDISKEGIWMAAKKYTQGIWCVGDLANAPFVSEQFNFILNILAPANYAEFKRMISHDGRIIKVIPGSGYLKELREMFYEPDDKQCYSNHNTIKLFESSFKLLSVKTIRYSIFLPHTWIEPLIQMTPLSWGTTEEHLLKARKMNLKEVTIDLTILAGKK